MSNESTPMMAQYRRVKSELPPDTILFFRLGDFYEMFYDDAITASRILDIALTRRQKAPMCGVPFHAAESYLAKLIRAGRKVAICEQMEDPSQTKGIVRREVTGIVSPGAVLSDTLLDSGRNNFIAGLAARGNSFGMAVLDISTGQFWGEEHNRLETLNDSLLRAAPSECVLPAEHAAVAQNTLKSQLPFLTNSTTTPYEDWVFENDLARDTLLRHLGVRSLDGFGLEEHPALIAAAGGLLHYVSQFLRRNIEHVRSFNLRNPSNFLVMDEATRINLDLVQSRAMPRASLAATGQSNHGKATLLGVLDVTRTPMGARLLRDWLLRPLTSPARICERQDAVAYFCRERALLHDLRGDLVEIRDLERVIARLQTTGGNARDLRALGTSLSALPKTRERLSGVSVPALRILGEAIQPLPDLAALIARSIVDEPPIPTKEGGMIRRGYHAELDELRDLATQGRAWLAEYQAREQERTGIKTLKVRHNKVFGYYIEISRAQAGNAPADYTRKQTLVGAERFITPELKEYENKILGAQDKSMALEHEIFLELRATCLEHRSSIQATAEALAQIDVLSTLAERALTNRYIRPTVDAEPRIEIRNGRHPVIEQIAGSERFVPNDTFMDRDRNRLLVITGPNMAGKSTYIRQVALIVIMAQMGSFVPAGAAAIGVTDRVFTRVGAGDDLVHGRSTFMVEMQETANILHNATARSLIVLDEIGRGTSTFDGISIAWAVAEHLHNTTAAKTLFATHYHELTDLALTMRGVKNYTVMVREKGDDIVFLRRIAPGAADKSYGIQVARLAGLPAEVVDRAKEILQNLEESELSEAGQPKLARRRVRKDSFDKYQLSLFEPPNPE